MGSKMAAASRVVQVVKTHTPLIKFPDRRSTPKPKIQESLESRVPPLHASSAQLSAGGRPSYVPNISFSSRIQGTPDTFELVRTLPQKYRRKSLSTEEMEYIQVPYLFWILAVIMVIVFLFLAPRNNSSEDIPLLHSDKAV